MDLITAFDLDFMMTSENEWGCYPALSGLAIYHLSRREGIDAVFATRWVWNGRKRVRVDSRLSGPNLPRPESSQTHRDADNENGKP